MTPFHKGWCVTVVILGLASFASLPETSWAEQPAAASPADAAGTDRLDVDSRETGEESPNALHRSAVRSAPFGKAKLQAEFSPTEKDSLKDNCIFGMPKTETGAGLGVIRIIARDGYSLGHSLQAKIPYWVCEHSMKEELSGPGDRNNSKFAADPLLKVGGRAELSDYKGSGFDRGHMHPAANAKKSQQMMDETHYLSNMVPQVGVTFNQGIWAELEGTVRAWTTKRGETWIISGPLFYDPLEENEDTADGLIPYDTIGEHDIAVPTHCFKIVLAKRDDGEHESIAFVLANRKYGKPYRLHLYVTTIDWIEERAGLNFFPDLDAKPELENAIEGKKSAMWETNE